MKREFKRPYRYPRQLEAIHGWMEAYRKEHGYSPNNREVAVAFPADNGNPRSTVVVRYWYERMEERGMVIYNRGISRGVVPIKQRKGSPA